MPNARITGYRPYDFVDKETGERKTGTTLYLAYPDGSDVIGHVAEKRSCPLTFKPGVIIPGNDYHVEFSGKGKVLSVSAPMKQVG
ncbi:hypothetical protein FACS18949_08910 [Clostridia bacterium]|nr:hypothetical protein FACS18949_08910 [Clostridia bacterium]